MTRRLGRAAKDTFRSFGIRNFRLFFTGQAISQTGTWMRTVALTLLVLDLTDSGLAVGILTACQFAPVLLLGAWAGVLADRSDKRKLLLGVQSLALLHSAALAALAFMDSPPVVALYAVAAVGGVAVALDNPARRALVVEMVPETHVQNAVSLNSAVMTGSRIVGPAIAGLLVTTVGYGWALAADAASYLAVLAGLWLMDTSQLRSAPVTTRAKGQVREGLRYARSVPELRISLLMMVLVGTLAFNFSVVFPLFTTRALDGSATDFTLFFSVVSAGSFLGALHAARRTHVGVKHVVGGAVAFGVSLLVLGTMPNLATALPVGFMVGMAGIVYMTSSTSLLQLRAAPTMRGRVLALQALVFFGSTPIGGPIVGGISEQFGSRFGLAVGGLACSTAAAWGWREMRRSATAPIVDPEPALGTLPQPA